VSRDVIPEWLAVIVFILSIVAAFCIAIQRDNLKEQAVKRGYAEWKVDAAGNAKWQWKEARSERR
jgi:hypothetical protein